MEINIINKKIVFEKKCFDVELELNKKMFQISIEEISDLNNIYCKTDWQVIKSIDEMTDDESDFIDDWVSEYNYL